MSRFKPVRTSSPPVRRRANTESLSTPAPKQPIRATPDDISISCIETLRRITPEDAQLIDIIIERTPATEKGFIPAYKAYHAVLQERGINPEDDVLYYESLLKINALKGVDWGDKWAYAKTHMNLVGSESMTLEHEAPPPSPSPIAPISAPLSSLRQTPGPSTRADRTPRPRARFVDETTPGPPSSRTSTADHQGEAPGASLQRLLRRLTVDDSSTTGRTETSSIATPSSRASNLAASRPLRGKEQVTPKPATRPAVRIVGSLDDDTPRSSLGNRGRFATPITPAPRSKATPAAIARIKREESAEPVLRTEEPARRRGNSEPDTWRLIKLEKDADHFRNDKLLEKFFGLWRQNAQWIRDTTDQISEARRKLALREFFTRWQEKTQVRLDMTRRAARVDAYFTERRVLLHWRQVLSKHRRQQWQTDMKKRLRTVRSTVDQRVLRQAWQKWRESRESTFALEQARGFHDAKTLHHCIVHWAGRLQKLRVLPIRALEFRAIKNKAIMHDIFETWKNRAELRVMERMTVGKRDQRIRKDTLLKWKAKSQTHKAARELHDRHLLRSALTTWRTKTKKVWNLERRANDYVRRQDRILLRAVSRVWAAKARGEQLARINRSQLLKDAFSVWRNRLVEVHALDDKAIVAIQNSQKDLLARAFYVIRSRVQTNRDDELLATRHYQKQLLASAFAEWRESAVLRRKQARQARIARRFFVERSAFGAWRAALAQKRLTNLEDQLKREKMREAFQVWKKQLKRHMMLKRVGDVVGRMVEQRVKYDALKKWIGAVVENKLQLLQAVDERNNRLQRLALEKWKFALKRHQEDMSLLRSFQDVKREDVLRRAFQRWLAAARHERLRRQRLERKEEQLRLEALGRAWDTWRDKFKEESLRATENLVRLQAQRSVVFSAFRLWESKSRALPALRFYADNVRRKAFEKWRASLPSAKLARVAREVDRENLLRKMMARWKESYQTKIGLKAVARARYLRLPPAAVAPRPSVLSSAAASRGGASSRPPLPSSSSTPAPLHFPRPSAVSLLGRKAVPERAASLPAETREPSPVTIAAARARSRSPVKAAASAPRSVPAAGPTPAPPVRTSLLSGFRVTPRPARGGTTPGPSAAASVRDESSDEDEEDVPQPRPLKSLATPLSERPSRIVGRRFAR